jgi:exopolyphosphatase/guanosine-5'-triphosphate,3'-diphosphate pyrophosphatase
MKPGLRDETLQLRARYDEEPSHSDHVADLARQLFDGLKPWHRLETRQRELLDSAAVLHDIGWSQTPDGRGHHKQSVRLIHDHAWENLASGEIAQVAQIARYHRKSIPQDAHAEFHALPAAAQKQVYVLGGILRLADALDRTHTGKITRVEATVTDDALVIRVQSRGPWDAERDMFETKRDMLELAAGRPIRCEAM